MPRTSCSPPFKFCLSQDLDGDCTVRTWLPIWNFGLGGSADYDAAIQDLNFAMTGCVWCPTVQAAVLPPWVLSQWPTAPASGSEGACFLMYVPFPRFAAILVCWERETGGGFAVPGGTAM